MKFRDTHFFHFKSEDLGVPAQEIVDLDPYLHQLEWDLYDVRRAQLNALSLGTSQLVSPHMIDFYLGNITLNKLIERLEIKVSPEKLDELLAIQPYRKRSMSQFNVDLQDSNFEPVPAPDNPYVQPDTGDYQRSLPRKYPAAAEEIRKNVGVQTIISYFSRLLAQMFPHERKVNVMIHPTSVVCRADRFSLPSLEGIHCDGADFIISALLVSRTNIQGGESVVYTPDREEVYRTTLRPGEGIFQSDKHLLHDATPVRLDPSRNEINVAVRNMVGFDFNFIS